MRRPQTDSGNREDSAFISGERNQILKGTGKRIQYWETEGIGNYFLIFGRTIARGEANLFQRNKGMCTCTAWEGNTSFQ